MKVHIGVHFDHVPTISSKRLPVSTFKDAVHLSPNDDYYLVTDSEGNIGNMRLTLTCVFPCIDTHFAMISLCNWLLISKELEK
jgi:hypothetical protein